MRCQHFAVDIPHSLKSMLPSLHWTSASPRGTQLRKAGAGIAAVLLLTAVLIRARTVDTTISAETAALSQQKDTASATTGQPPRRGRSQTTNASTTSTKECRNSYCTKAKSLMSTFCKLRNASSMVATPLSTKMLSEEFSDL